EAERLVDDAADQVRPLRRGHDRPVPADQVPDDPLEPRPPLGERQGVELVEVDLAEQQLAVAPDVRGMAVAGRVGQGAAAVGERHQRPPPRCGGSSASRLTSNTSRSTKGMTAGTRTQITTRVPIEPPPSQSSSRVTAASAWRRSSAPRASRAAAA